MKLHFSNHAIVRMAQRSFSGEDVELILLLGREVEDGYMVLEKDCREAEQKLKGLMQRLRRLMGRRLVVKDNRVLTAYHASPRKERSLLRKAEEREIARPCDTTGGGTRR